MATTMSIVVAMVVATIAGSGLTDNDLETHEAESAELASPEAFQQKPPVPRGNRLLGIETTTVPTGRTYDDNIAKAFSVHAQATCMSIQWNEIEPSPKTYVDPNTGLAIANLYYPSKKMKLSLIIRSVDTVVVPVPSDLKNTKFDDAKMISRFCAMLDWVFLKIPDVDLASLQIGNEVDLNAISSATFWGQYKTFVAGVVKHVHAKRPGTLTGFTVTHKAAGSPLQAKILAAAEATDLIGITYYPLNDDFSIQPSSVVAGDFTRIVNAFGSKPIHLAEIGLPTGAANKSSNTRQSQFLESAFAAWDQHADKIPYMSIDRLVDYAPNEAKSMSADYGISGNAAFTSFIETLGLQSYSGVDKSALLTLKRLTEERGW